MDRVLGAGDFRFVVDDQWLSPDPEFGRVDVSGVAVDADDRLYVFNRGARPMVVLDGAGTEIDAWGMGLFTHPHGVHIAADGTVYCTDDGDHTVRRCGGDGTVLLELGTPGVPAPFMSGRPFRRCTHTALSPSGDIWVTDGYGNNRVHRYSPAGELIGGFGSPGVGPGEFNLPHCIVSDEAGMVYVADRENHRIQVFDDDAIFVTEWRNLHRPSTLIRLPGEPGAWLVGEIGPVFASNRGTPNLGPRLSVLDDRGVVVCRLGAEPAAGVGYGQFLSPHGMARDSSGNVYVAQVGVTAWPKLFPDCEQPAQLPNLIRLMRLA